MTVNTILQAIRQGYNVTHIIDWLSRNHPKLSRNIKAALKQGYTHDKIAEYLTEGRYASHGQRNQMLEGMSEQEKAERLAQGAPGDWKKPLSTALNVGATALGAYGLARGLPMAASAIGGILGGNNPQPGPQPMSNAPIQPPPIASMGALPAITPAQNQSPLQQAIGTNQISPSSGQNTAQTQLPSPQQTPSYDSVSIIQELGLEEKVNNLLAQGKSPEEVSRSLVGSFNPKQRKVFTEKVQRGLVPSTFTGLVKDYASKANIQHKVKPVKGDIVATPHGLADLESIKEKEALIKDDEGKVRKVKVDDLIHSPLPKKDLASLHDELVKGIEEKTGEDVSRNVNWAGYDPKTNTLAYLPHLGALYTYEDILPEDQAQLTSLMSQRKTTGENFIGAWKEGTKSPIGAAMAALIRKLQSERGGKGQEYSGKFETIYDALEPAKQAAKKKHAEMKKKRKK